MKTERAVRPLPVSLQPQVVALSLTLAPQLISNLKQELSAKARKDPNHCFGYFPAMADRPGIDIDLPASRAFAKALPAIPAGGKILHFNFVRLSLVQQPGTSHYHLDTDAATALSGNITNLSNRLVWRLLLNLHTSASRTLGYLDVRPDDVRLQMTNGYLHGADDHVKQQRKQRISIPPRQTDQVHGVLFCASRVLHTGPDDQQGHFVAGFGCEAESMR